MALYMSISRHVSLILFYKEYSIISSGSYQLLEYLEDPFHLPMSRKAYEEFQQLEIICEEVRSSEYRDSNDRWGYLWVLLISLHQKHITA